MYHHHLNLGYIIVNSLIHAVIYGAVFHLFKNLSTFDSVLLAGAVVAAIIMLVLVFRSRRS